MLKYLLIFTVGLYGSLSVAKPSVAKPKDLTTPVATVGKPAPDFSLKDGTGKVWSLTNSKGKYVVLEWYNKDCPFVRNQYDSSNMQALQTKYTNKGVTWYLIESSAKGNEGFQEPKDAAKQLDVEKSKATALLLDNDGKVGRAYGAKTTPHMFVIDPKGIIIYAGAIDDMPSASGDHSKASNYVANALDAEMSEPKKPIVASSSKPYGCGVKYQN